MYIYTRVYIDIHMNIVLNLYHFKIRLCSRMCSLSVSTLIHTTLSSTAHNPVLFICYILVFFFFFLHSLSSNTRSGPGPAIALNNVYLALSKLEKLSLPLMTLTVLKIRITLGSIWFEILFVYSPPPFPLRRLRVAVISVIPPK